MSSITRSSLHALLLLSSSAWLGCTVETDSNDGSGGKGSKTSASGNQAGSLSTFVGGAGGVGGGSTLGGSSGTFADAGAPNVAGAANGTSSACGLLTEAGSCEKEVLAFCEAGVPKRLDCGSVGATCQVVGVTASCQAEVRALSCGELTKLGTCDGAKIRYCDLSGLVGVPREIDCAAYGQRCAPTGAPGDNGAYCVPQGACPSDVSEEGVCNGNQLRFCQDGNLYEFDCGLDQCKAIAGFSDCFMSEVASGCGEETAAGRCDGQTRIACSGSVVVREDCAAVGLECRPSAAGVVCQASSNCLASCPSGYTCQSGRCQPSATPAREWTLLVYMVGDNNLSDAAWVDLNEMETVGSSDKLAIAVQAKFSSQYSNLVPPRYQGPTYRFLVQKDADEESVSSLDSAANIGSTNMSDGAALTSFVRWATEAYPAKRTALILWDHGIGFEGGFVDESAGGNDYLTLKEIAGGIVGSGVHVDLVGFDACLMGLHEVALAMRGVADWMTASEEIEPGAGYPYDQVLTHLQQTPTLTPQQLGTAIVEEYRSYYAASQRSRPATQSLMDLSKIGALQDQLAGFANNLSSNLAESRLEVLNTLGSADLLRFRMESLADLGTATAAFGHVTGAVGAAATSLGAAYQNSGVVVSNGSSGSTPAATGLAMFLPEPDYSATDLLIYRQETDFLPLQPWYTALANLRNNQSAQPVAGTGAIDDFSLVLSWGKTSDSKASEADLDLYVYEPNGDFAVAVNGTVSQNGILSGDSYDTGVSSESYQLKPDHEAGTYIVLVHYYDGPAKEKAYPRLQLFRSDLPGGSRMYVRGKISNRVLTEVPMSNDVPLTTMIDETNFAGVQNLDYSNIWYAFTVEVSSP